MVPVRLSLLLIGSILVLLLSFANPEPVQLHLLFWSGRFELYKVLIGSLILGALLAWIFTGHVRYVRRLREGRFRRSTR